jgi:integrase
LVEQKRTAKLNQLPIIKDYNYIKKRNNMKKTAKNRINFTKNALINLPIPSQSRAVYYDTNEDKLYLQITPAGTKTFYLLKKVNTETLKIKIGRFPDMAIDKARSIAKTLKAEIENGINPAEQKRQFKQDITFYEMYEEFKNKYSLKEKKASSCRNDEYNIQYCKNLFNKKITQIQKDDIKVLFNRISDTNGNYQANHVLELIRAMFNKMISWGWNGQNPTVGIHKHKSIKRSRFIQPEELPVFYRQLKTCEQYVQDIVMLSLLTGARKSNVMAMNWKDISFISNQWFIEGKNTKNGEDAFIYLNTEAMKILNRRKNERIDNNEWVFPSPKKSEKQKSSSGHITDIKKSWKALLNKINAEFDCEADKITNLRFHDLRRTFGSYQASNGISLPIIAKSLTHKSMQSTEIYSKIVDEATKSASELVASKIKELIK